MPRLHLLRSSYDLLFYYFLYDSFDIVGGYKLRLMCLHCLRSPYNFFRRQTRTKLYRDLADIARQPQGYRTIIVLTSQIARCPYDDLAEVARSRYADCAIDVYYLHEFKRPSMFIFGYTFQSHVIANRAMNRLVFFVEHGPKIDDTIPLVTFVYILMSIFKFCSFHKV